MCGGRATARLERLLVESSRNVGLVWNLHLRLNLAVLRHILLNVLDEPAIGRKAEALIALHHAAHKFKTLFHGQRGIQMYEGTQTQIVVRAPTSRAPPGCLLATHALGNFRARAPVVSNAIAVGTSLLAANSAFGTHPSPLRGSRGRLSLSEFRGPRLRHHIAHSLTRG